MALGGVIFLTGNYAAGAIESMGDRHSDWCDIVKTRFIVQAALLWLVTCFASEADHSMGSFGPRGARLTEYCHRQQSLPCGRGHIGWYALPDGSGIHTLVK
jgi:hypothetical protein